MNKILICQKIKRRRLIAVVLAFSLFAQTGGADIPFLSSACRNILGKLNGKPKQSRNPSPLKPDDVNSLVDKYKDDPDGYAAFEYDLRRRMTTGDFKTSEVFAAAILDNERAGVLWKQFEASSKNVYIGWNFLSPFSFIPSQRSRVISERDGGFFGINPFKTRYDVLVPPKVPLDASPRLLKSLTDAMAKVTAGQNKLYVLQRAFYNIAALPIATWELFKNIVIATDAGFKINTAAPKLVTYRLLIRTFEHDSVQRKQLLEATNWYFEDPSRLSSAAPGLTLEQQMILRDKGFDGLMNNIIVNKGTREAIQFFNRVYPWFFVLASLIVRTIVAGAGAALNGKNNQPDKNACLPTAAYDQKINSYDFSPFDKVFINIEGTMDSRDKPFNPCDPTGEIRRTNEKLKKLYPGEATDDNPLGDIKRKWYEGQTPEGLKLMKHLRDIIYNAYNAPNSQCRIHYAQVMSCGKGVGI